MIMEFVSHAKTQEHEPYTLILFFFMKKAFEFLLCPLTI